MPTTWLTAVSWAALALALAASADITIDIYARRYHQQMSIMDAVWPITALYFGLLASWAYRRFGRPTSRRWREEHGGDEPPPRPDWVSTAAGVSHCGAGCVLGDVLAEFVIFALGAAVAGAAVFAEMIGDYLAAVGLGVVFQYFAIAPTRGLSLRKGLLEAAKADVLSLTSFEVGLFGWMTLMAFVSYPAPHQLRPDSPVYWFLMQLGMIIGFATAWPTNTWLIRHGLKEAM